MTCVNISNIKTRDDTNVWLIGPRNSEILGAKLPTKQQVMSQLFYLISQENPKTSVRYGATIVTNNVIGFWNRAAIPTREKQHIIKCIEVIYKEWNLLRKSKHRDTQTQRAKENKFKGSMSELFDIAHDNAPNLMKNKDDKLFLEIQRQGHSGCMGPMDRSLALKDKRSMKRKTEEDERMQKQKKTEELSIKKPILRIDNATMDEDNTIIDPNFLYTPPPSKNRLKENVMSPELAAVLDRTKTSDRNATYLLAAAFQNVGKDLSKITLNKESIRKCRLTSRSLFAADVKENFKCIVPLVVHMDGKRLVDEETKEIVERLAILVSGIDIDQFLGAPKLTSGTGDSISSLVKNTLEDWNIVHNVVGVCFDTCSVNTGAFNGACALLEKKMDKTLLHLACRHHILEILLSTAFHVCFGSSKSPEPAMFKKFQSSWNQLDHNNFEVPENFIPPCKAENLKAFAMDQLKQFQPRDDYKEMLQLVTTFCSKNSDTKFSFKRPGAISNARWMAKAIYSLKIMLFRSQVPLSDEELHGLTTICKFILNFYVTNWFLAPVTVMAPSQDLLLLKQLKQNKAQHLSDSLLNLVITEVLKKSLKHTWYLHDKLIPLSLFDPSLSLDMKRKISYSMINTEIPGQEHVKPSLLASDISKVDLTNFITKNTVKFFDIINVPIDFLHKDPSTWNNDQHYIRALNIVKNIKVVNDSAERGVSLMTQYNSCLTKSEKCRQDILQVVNMTRKQVKSCKKSNLVMTL